MNQIWIEGSGESKGKQIYDAVYNIEAEKNRRACTGLVAYNDALNMCGLGSKLNMRNSIAEIGREKPTQTVG